ncbi:MAG: hypothetical protein U5N86_00315 [Planctomycetota bacterium]|nr:hypothetical protein [Planctomycetota bacterium]
MREYEYNESEAAFDPQTARHGGKQVAAQYILSGEFSSIEMPRGSEKRVYYNLTLRLTDVARTWSYRLAKQTKR